MIGLDISQEVLHHDFSRVFIEEVICRGDIIRLTLVALLLLLVIAQVLLEHVELDAAEDDEHKRKHCNFDCCDPQIIAHDLESSQTGDA